jgi:hypothetical protein
LTGEGWRVRRAVVDDLGPLADLWRAAQMPAENLDKKFTDFQVVEDAAGQLHAGVALEIADKAGRIHSEAIADFALADTLRPLLWARLRSVAQNHGLFRLWTQEKAPFWKKDAGFAAASAEGMEKFPEAFGSPRDGWLTLQLRDERADPDSIERQFAAFKETERAKREKLLSQVRPLKWIGIGIGVVLLIIGFIAIFYSLKIRAIR